MASVGKNDKLEIVEASVANPGRGITRSNLVKPDLCVITSMGYAHVDIHGSVQNMIKNKAEIVHGLKRDGICVINATSVNFDRIREEIYKIKYVDFKTFGVNPKCNAYLIESKFDNKKFLWNIKASIEGLEVEYQVHLVGEHVPVSSLAPLLTVYHLGYDVKKAAESFKDFRSAETMGKISKIKAEDKEFYFFDHSQRAAVLNYRSALINLKRMEPKRRGKKIAVIGNMLEIDKISKKAHEGLAPLIDNAGIDRLYTVGILARVIRPKLKNRSIFVKHVDKYEEIQEQILDEIGDGDVLFIKGSSGAKLENLANKVYALGESHEV
jgi:UDP-N-acetylmuramoyl-tripeptide--D-alanyl-D-alanine ligase